MDEERKRYIDVLNAFIDRCPDPSPHEIAAWTAAYPQYAKEIRRTAADALAINRITGGRRGAPPTEAEVDAEFAEIAPSLGFDADATLTDVIDGSGQDLQQIARRLDIGVDMLVSLEEGLCASAPPTRFIDAFANVVALPRRKVRAAIEASRREGGLALAASMSSGATAHPVPWDELVATSAMAAGRKAFWRSDAPAG